MASQTATSKPASRWGSLLQQAVAGVESRLDTILAEGESPPSANSKDVIADQPLRKETTASSATTRSSEESISHAPSTSRKNDRLQEKLAKAMINRNSAGQGGVSTTPSSLPSRTASPLDETENLSTGSKSNAQSKDLLHGVGVRSNQISDVSILPGNLESEEQVHLTSESAISSLLPSRVRDDSVRDLTESDKSHSTHQSPDIPQATSIPSNPTELNGGVENTFLKPTTQSEEHLDQMRSDYETAELRRQEETHLYVERIDALQAKLQYLTREAMESAQKAATSSEPGSLEQKLAVKDEKIALLMQEGHKLSQTEFKLLDTIKKLRAKSAKEENQALEAKKAYGRHERAAREAQERAVRAEMSQRKSFEQLKLFQKFEKDLEVAVADNSAKSIMISDLRDQIHDAQNNADLGELNNCKELLEAEKKLSSDLREDLSNAKIERELCADRHRTEARDLREQREREKERARVTEIELRGEQTVLESRLEALRERFEEASSVTTGDAHTKLLRQIETLQTQYSVASENWQGIESSLLAKISHLEKERDETVKKEAELRRKARETKINSRQVQDELESTNSRAEDLERKLANEDHRLKTLQDKFSRCELEMLIAKKDLATERESWEVRLAERLEEEKASGRENGTITPEIIYQNSRAESPVTTNLRAALTDRPNPHGSRQQGLPGLGLISPPVLPAERPISRRTSTQPIYSPGNRQHHRHGSLSTTPQLSTNGIAETPFNQTEQQEDFFEGVVTPATPERTINDVLSVSTSGAGPSVQLVERMSSAVRRLESEKATSQDEIKRLSVQADEAREQIILLMREAEEKRAADEKIKTLQAEMDKMNQRYQTTLEMLGEKSELVEELRADVTDVKQMYRDLVDSTMR